MRVGQSGRIVVKPFHPNHLITTRCDSMRAQVSRDWRVFKQILADHWNVFQHAHPRYQTSYDNDLVAKMLGCGNPDKMGYLDYRCHQCGQGQHLVSMSSQSSLCLRGSKVYVDSWVSQVSNVLHARAVRGRPSCHPGYTRLEAHTRPAVRDARTERSTYRADVVHEALAAYGMRLQMSNRTTCRQDLLGRLNTKPCPSILAFSLTLVVKR